MNPLSPIPTLARHRTHTNPALDPLVTTQQVSVESNTDLPAKAPFPHSIQGIVAAGRAGAQGHGKRLGLGRDIGRSQGNAPDHPPPSRDGSWAMAS